MKGKSCLKPIRRVMLIFPPMFDIKHVDTMSCPPMGIASLAAFVRDIVEVRLLDALISGVHVRKPVNENIELVGLDYDDIIDRVREYEPDLVGLSCLFSNQFASIKEIVRRIKAEVDPEIVTVAGGTHPSFLPERALSAAELDYVVLGEGELTFRDLILAHNQGRDISGIDGLAFRDGGGIVVNPRVNLIENLDELPLPARDLLDMEAYFKYNVPMGLHFRKRRNVPVVTSRGCPNQCRFCSSAVHWGRRYRYRSPESVLAEIEHLREAYGVEELKFQDDNLTMPRWRAEAIFQGMIDRGLAMPWNTPNGVAVWTLDEHLVGLMKKSGCYEFTLAIESGDPWVLENIVKKPLKLEKAVEVRRLARKHGIMTMGYFIIGFPGESMEQIRTTIRFGLDLGLDYMVVFIFSPLPGTEMWRECLEKGYISDDYHYEEANNYFKPDLDIPGLVPDELTRLQRTAYFKSLLLLPVRNPRGFLSYYFRLFFTRPDFLRTFIQHAAKALK